ncbi:MAG: ATP synthase F1 subunit delta [Deltaproteobacteria bacterium]|nr:ATP synthase F1 subunit delta [Deltaproteobacteria bacterium]
MASVATLRDLVEALIETAERENKTKKVKSDMVSFYDVITAEETLKKVLGSSAYETSERIAIINDLGEKMGFDKLITNFISLAIELDKFKTLLKSQVPIITRLRKASGTILAEITFGESPSESDLNKIKEGLERLTGKEIETVVKIDPSIIGGIITKVEDRVFDGSIKTQLERIRGALSLP